MTNQAVTDKLRRQADQTSCHACGRPLEADSQFCRVCGAPTPAAGERRCLRCGGANQFDARFCGHCGASVTEPPTGAAPSTSAAPPWGQIALGGLGGLLVGSLLGGGRGPFAGGGDWDGFNGSWEGSEDDGDA